MEGLLAAEPAILVELQTIGIVLLVLKGIVIPLLALGAGQRDLNAHGISPSRWYSIKNKPPHGGTLHRLPQGRSFVNENLSIFSYFLRRSPGFVGGSILSYFQGSVHPFFRPMSAFFQKDIGNGGGM